MSFNPNDVRGQFPALVQEVNGSVPVFFDGPGGAQVPQCVIDGMGAYLARGNSNMIKSPFFAVENTHEIVKEARTRAAAFVNAPAPENMIFGANMTSITAHLSRSIAREWEAGDEIIVSALDHHSNVSFWKQEARDRGVTVHVVRAKPDDLTLDYDHMEELISPKTKFIAFTMAANVCGSLVDAPRVIALAKSVGAMTYIDAVHYSAHFLPDVQALDCDFLACSAYKFGGPHLGFVYGRAEHLERLTPFKVEYAPAHAPDCWETGTKSFEDLSGFISVVDYCSNNSGLRIDIKAFYEDFLAHEQAWSKAFLERAADFKGMHVYGITDLDRIDERSATFALSIDGHAPQDVSEHLARHNISAGAGMFYGNGVIEAIGRADQGGVLRIGALHYNTIDELDRCFEILAGL